MKYISGIWLLYTKISSSTNKTDRHEITEILLKVALNTIKQTNHDTYSTGWHIQ
jgi:hypothetical protein